MPRASKKGEKFRPVVLRDSREQPGHGFTFPAGPDFGGTEVVALPTGDYTMKGYEHLLCIERKGSVSEIATNFTEDRFFRELDRMEAFPHPILLCEFSWSDVLAWPRYSGLPKSAWSKVKISGAYLASCLTTVFVRRKIHVLLVGKTAGERICRSIFKRTIEEYGQLHPQS